MTTSENNQDHTEDDDVIDAEIIVEQEAEAPKDRVSSTASNAQGTKGGKVGWIIALILLVFVGGLFAAPYVRGGLVDAGILAPVVAGDGGGQATTAARQDRAALQQRIADTEQKLEHQQEMIAQLLERADSEASARSNIAQDLALLAAQGVNTTGNQATDGQTAALKAEISRLTDETARLAALANSTDPELSAVNGQIALARAETNQLKNQMAAMEAVISGLQAGALDTTPRGRLLVALGRIKEQAQTGLAFGAELNSLQLDLSALPALDQQLVGADFAVLNNHADGILSFQALSQRYNETARSIKLAHEKAEGGLLSNLFTVRRTDDNATGIDAILLEAERRLSVRDVSGAVQVLSALEGEARAAAAPWLEQAQAHAETLSALDRILRMIAGRAVASGMGGQE